jgi:uncharacterized membrane protein YhdT
MLEAVWLVYLALGIMAALVHVVVGLSEDLQGLTDNKPNYNCKWFYISCVLFAVPFLNLVYLGMIISDRVNN